MRTFRRGLPFSSVDTQSRDMHETRHKSSYIHDMKRIVIMGATSGIGLRVAEMYATAGWTVGVAGRKDGVMKELSSRFPGRVEWQHIDITRREAPAKLKELIGKLGGMDIYLHVSGIGFENPALNTDHETETVRTNAVGFTRMVRSGHQGHRGTGELFGHKEVPANLSRSSRTVSQHAGAEDFVHRHPPRMDTHTAPEGRP